MGSLLSEMSSHSLVLTVLNKPRWWSLIIKVPRAAKRERMSLPRPAVYWPLPRMKHYGVNKQQIKKQGLQTVWVKSSSTLALYRYCLSHALCNKDISGEEWTGLIYWCFPCKHVGCLCQRYRATGSSRAVMLTLTLSLQKGSLGQKTTKMLTKPQSGAFHGELCDLIIKCMW